MKQDEQDQLWELLGKAPERKASPFFANKVMHAIHREPEEVSAWSWIRRWWFVPATASAMAAVAAFALFNDPAGSTSAPRDSNVATEARPAKADPLTEMVTVIADTDEFEASLSDLVATEDNSVWLAADPSSLF
jgi:hypothetical protein